MIAPGPCGCIDNWKSHYRIVTLLMICLTAFLPGATQAAPQDKNAVVRPTDCYIHSLNFAVGLEKLRLEMGKPKVSEYRIIVRNAKPREVFFQAETLFTKINRLSFELIREEFPEPEVPTGEIRPADVLIVIEQTQAVLDRILSQFDIEIPAPLPTLTDEKQPTDVFNQLTQVNRQINLMLDQPFLPGDVFRRVTQCINYATELRARFSGPRIPDTPEYERQKRPSDVYLVLRDSFGLTSRIASLSGLETLEIDNLSAPLDDTIAPGDVYDFASLLLAELRFLHRQLGSEKPPPDSYHPGRKFPSHVHQRARLLRNQLADLETLVQSNPGWLSAK